MMLAMTMFVAMPTKAFADTRVGDLDCTVFTDDESNAAEGWSWAHATKTLTINGLDLEGSIILPDGSTIMIEGANFITVIDPEGFGVGIGGMGDLTIISEGSLSITSVFAGILANSDLDISGGVFTVYVDDTDDYWQVGIASSLNTTITDATITVENAYQGIGAGFDLTINGGSIEVKDCFYGLFVFCGDVIIEGNAVIGIDAQIGIVANATPFGPDEVEPYFFGALSSSAVGLLAAAAPGNVLITGGTIVITAELCGIRAEGNITIKGGSIRITDCIVGLVAMCGDVVIEGTTELDITALIGIAAYNTDLSSLMVSMLLENVFGALSGGTFEALAGATPGNVIISGGTIDIVADWYGIEADGDITISNAMLTIAITGDDEFIDDEDIYDAPMGIVSWEGDITILSGSVTINPAEPEGWYHDGIHAENGTVLISGGTVTINSADDDGIQALFIIITGGTVVIFECGFGLYSPLEAYDRFEPEALEGSVLAPLDAVVTVCIEGGTVTITVEYDGILAYGDVVISGGKIIITAGDDGIQADGNVILSGGNLTILADDNGIWTYLGIAFCGSIVDITSMKENAVYADNGIITFTAGSGTIKTLWDDGDDYWATASETGITVGDGIVVLGWDGSDYTVKSAVGAFDFGDDGEPWFWYTFVKDADKDVVLLNIWFGPTDTPATGDNGGMVGLIVALVALGLGGLFIVVGARRRQSVS